jgi:hypothetical protein
MCILPTQTFEIPVSLFMDICVAILNKGNVFKFTPWPHSAKRQGWLGDTAREKKTRLEIKLLNATFPLGDVAEK